MGIQVKLYNLLVSSINQCSSSIICFIIQNTDTYTHPIHINNLKFYI